MTSDNLTTHLVKALPLIGYVGTMSDLNLYRNVRLASFVFSLAKMSFESQK